MTFFVSILVFSLFLFGMFLVTKLSISEMSTDMDAIMNRQIDIRKRVIKQQKNKKDNFFLNILRDMKLTLASLGQSSKFMIVCIMSIILAFLGAFTAVAIGNAYLIPAFFIGFISLPFVFVRSYSYSYQRHLQSELELSLSQITTTYLRTDDIIAAIEENIENIGSPVRQVFESFVSQVKFINPNIRQGIDDMKAKIDNKVFKEWCECMKRCNQNRTLKYMLLPVVSKFSTLREISGSIQEALNGYKLEFFIIMGVVYINYPLIWFMEKSWFDVLMSTTQGHITTGFIALVSVICSIILSFILKPIDYDV